VAVCRAPNLNHTVPRAGPQSHSGDLSFFFDGSSSSASASDGRFSGLFSAAFKPDTVTESTAASKRAVREGQHATHSRSNGAASRERAGADRRGAMAAGVPFELGRRTLNRHHGVVVARLHLRDLDGQSEVLLRAQLAKHGVLRLAGREPVQVGVLGDVLNGAHPTDVASRESKAGSSAANRTRRERWQQADAAFAMATRELCQAAARELCQAAARELCQAAARELLPCGSVKALPCGSVSGKSRGASHEEELRAA
jgi:hypothetical protein